jgi:hypothetical protein
MKTFLKLFIVFAAFAGPISTFACGEKDACPASSCDKKRCMDYIERKGEYANRLRLRCIDLCHSACSDLLKDELKACEGKKSGTVPDGEEED